MFKSSLKKRCLSIGTIIIFLMAQILSSQVLATETIGLGDLVYQENVTFAPGAAVNTYVANHPSLPQEREQVFTIEFKPADQKIKFVTSHGNKLYGTETLSKLMDRAGAEGYNVIGGINADYFDIDKGTGAPVGHEVRNGRLMTAGGVATFETVGFTAAGEVFIDFLKIDMTMKFDTPTGPVSYNVNRFNKAQDTQICIYDNNFAATTKGTEPSLNLICDVNGIPTINGTVTLKIEEIIDNAMNVSIPADKMVISLDVNTPNQARLNVLRNLAVGDTLLVGFKDKNAASRWGEVQEAVSGRPLIDKGVLVQKEKVTDIHPRTCIGLKPDGTLVVFAVDGRQPGYSGGLNLIDIGNYLLSQGCVEAINLDGGGSTTIAARMPGDSLPTILNRPSDGRERSVGNALILVSNTVGDGQLANLHINPVKSLLLAGSSIDFTVKGTDNAYEPVSLQGAPEWSSSGSIGTIDSNGRFTAGTQTGGGYVQASFGGKTAAADIQIVDNADLKLNVAELNLNPGESFDLNVTASWNGIPVRTADNQFSWSVEGNIGIVDSSGLFKAVNALGVSGKVKVTHGPMSILLNVNVGKEPVIIDDFEDGITGWKASSANLPSTNVNIYEETNEQFVRFGNKSLKLEYDMANGTSTTVGAYVEASPAVPIDGYPTHIGMWVYGDNKKHWLRGQLLDGNNASFYVDFTSSNTGVDWEGWKYVEAPIPAGKTMPLKVDMPVRYMETNKENVTSGVLYIDNIRAVYKYKNDDLIPPSFTLASVGENIAVVDNGSTFEDYRNLVFTVSDNQSGIKSASITINNITSGASNVYNIDPSGELKLEIDFDGAVGSYKALIRASDITGNNLRQEVMFNVTTSISSMGKLMVFYQGLNELKGPLVPQLENSLKQAEFFENTALKEKEKEIESNKQAIAHMRDFIKHLNNPALQENVSVRVKQVLNADAEAMIKMWSK